MRREGNGDPFVCAQNLINTTITEVPFSRSKGLDPGMMDEPVTGIEAIDETITELIEEYEPRIMLESIGTSIDPQSGEVEIVFDSSIAESMEEESEDEEDMDD